MKHALVLTVALSAFVIGGCDSEPKPVAQSGPVTTTGQANVGGPYTLINQDGETVTEASFVGKPHLVFFGFTYCPDVCPMGLQQMGAALDELGRDASKIQPILISLDPERDTPELMAQYVTANGFPDNLVGLTGTPAQVEVAVKAYRVYSKKVSLGEDADDYTIDHTSYIYLMDKDGKYAAVFTKHDSPETIATQIKPYLK